MKTKKLELDVDFIGGQEPLIAADERTLSDFFKQRKLTSKKSFADKKAGTTTGSKSTNL
jgi:hypothetical protein